MATEEETTVTSSALAASYRAEATQKIRGCKGDQVLAKVQRALLDNFADFDEMEIHGTPRNGKTLWQRLYDDKVLWLAGSHGPMGKPYYNDLKELYRSQASAKNRLVYPEGCSVSDEWIDGIEGVLAHPPRRGTLLALLRGSSSMVKGHAVAVMKLLVTLKVSTSKPQLDMALAIIECLCRCDMWTALPVHRDVCRDFVDAALLKATELASSEPYQWYCPKRLDQRFNVLRLWGAVGSVMSGKTEKGVEWSRLNIAALESEKREFQLVLRGIVSIGCCLSDISLVTEVMKLKVLLYN
eukprot:6461401-Amphidinium_carterae.2